MDNYSLESRLGKKLKIPVKERMSKLLKQDLVLNLETYIAFPV